MIRRNAPASAPRARIHLAVFLTLVATIAVVGRGAYATLRSQFDVDLRRQIEEIADAKAKQVAAWRTERLGDAAVAVAGAQLMPAVPEVLRGSAKPETAEQLRAWLAAIRLQYQYETIVLVDSAGRTRLAAGELLATPGRYAALAAEALQSTRIVFRDLPRDASVSRSHLTLALRLTASDGSPSGAIVLGIDPSIPRYRLILTWPSDSVSGEIVLARRDGDTALYLSAPRRQPGSAMTLREDLSNRESPLARAALGIENASPGVLSGANVIAAARRVPESDWLVVASLDADEAYAPLRQTLVRLVEIGGVLVLTCGVGIAMIWRYQRSTFERQVAEAERERQALAGHYEFLTRFGNDAIALVDEDGFIKEVNDRAVEWFGYSRDELLQLHVRALRGPEDAASFDSTWEAIKRQRSLVFETLGYRKDRTTFPMELSVRVIDVEGRTYVQSIVRDITERRQAETQIRRLNRLYAVLSACGQAIVQAASEADLFSRVCRIAVEHGGFLAAAVGTFKGEPRQLVPAVCAGDATAAIAALESSTPGTDRHGVTSAIVLPLVERGTEVGVLALCAGEASFFNEAETRLAQEVAASVSYALDSLARDHQRRSAEGALRVSRDRLERVLDAIDEGYWDWNRATGELHLSTRYYTMLGYVPGDLQVGSEFLGMAMVHPDDAKIVDGEFARVEENGQNTFSMEIRLRCKSGQYIWALSRGKVVERDANGKPARLAGTHTDITEQKKLEEQFLQAQKLESVGRLAGGVAHDFNNLLTVINGYSEVMLGKLPVGDPHRRFVDAIHQAGNRAAGLTEQLLAFSRKQVTQPRALGLNAVVGDAERLLLRLVREDVEMITRFEAAADHVIADPSQLHQVIMNLVVNARDAMPEGGRLVIATRNDDVPPGEPDLQAGRYVVLSVADTGTGMDEDTRAHIFEPFFTTKERGKGTGLGLSTVYGIVQQSGGAIRVDSVVGKGTTFHVYLPQVSAELVQPVAAVAPKTQQGSETILIAEDQQLVRELAVDTLRGLGYRVLAASNGDEALRIASEHTGAIHLLLTDIVMPGGIDGWMLAERVSAVRPGLKVIYTSGYTDDVVGAQRMLDAGAAYLPKPFTPAMLSAKIRDVLSPGEVGEEPARPVLKRTVLVVDDDEAVRALFPTLLGHTHRVLLAADGKEAVDIARRELQLDLVLTDLFMPNQDGIETIQALQELRPALRIIAMSGAFDGQFLSAAERLGVDATLKKPIELETLRRTVDEVLNRALRPA
jgi:PAS domain S-box-containing protein